MTVEKTVERTYTPNEKEPLAGGVKGSYSPTTVSVPPAEMMTEQEKDTASEVPGVGPVSASEVSPGPVETIEDQGIGPRTPYPTGNPPQPAEAAKGYTPVKGSEPKETPNKKETR